MELSKLKNLVRENGDKVIFMENGEPELVMMSFAEYEKLARLHIPDIPPMPQPKSAAQKTDREMRGRSEDMGHETEFLAPIEIAPVRTASVQGDQFSRTERNTEPARMSDIRLEDLPI